MDGELLEEFEINNGLRQGRSMPQHCSTCTYMCVVGERWLSRVAEMEDVGSYLRYKFDQQLFRRYTRNASEDTIKECQFADDVAMLATNRVGAETTIRAYFCVAKSLGLTVNIIKTKFMVVGHDIVEEDTQPISLVGGEIEHVSKFPYLGSSIAAN